MSLPSPSQPSNPGPNRLPAHPAIDPSSLVLALNTLQNRLDQLQQSLNHQNKLATLGMITAVIAHEFNNILTPMISYTRFALSGKADDALRTKALEKALSGGERLANISQSLLGFARGDESSRANVAHALKETLACLSRDLSKDGITLTASIPDDLTVAMNAGQFQQVLMNLIVNARSAMLAAPAPDSASPTEPRSRTAVSATRRAPGLKRLTLTATIHPHFNTAELAIADTGPGIPPDVLPRIFEPFFSTKRPTAADAATPDLPPAEEPVPKGGTGLGLTICQELIHAANGTIRAASELNKGTTFTIELPLAPAPTKTP